MNKILAAGSKRSFDLYVPCVQWPAISPGPRLRSGQPDRLALPLLRCQTGFGVGEIYLVRRKTIVMSSVSCELENLLSRLDSETATLLERTVRDALALAERRTAAHAVDALGYPLGYFEATAGSFANEPLERPTDLPMETREPW